MKKKLWLFVAAVIGLLGSPLHAGSLKVTLAPSQAVTAGAQWRVDNGSWKNSGTTVKNLSNTTHQVSFKTIAGWITPATTTVSITSGTTTTLTATYVQPASLRVDLTPATGQWRLDGGTWQSSGATAANLLPGNHTVEYSALAGYTAPISETVALSTGQSASLSRSYTELASFSVTLDPSQAQWRLDGGAWNGSGAVLAQLAPGMHTIDYAPVAGYLAPASETVNLVSGVNPPFSRTYTPEPASLTVTLSPTEAQWRVDGGAWLPSSSTASGLASGTHTVEFTGVLGYATPAQQSVALTNGEHRSLSVSYTPVASVYVVFNPQWIQGQWRIDGGAWQPPGTSAYNLVAGVPHTIEYSSVDGYVTPTAESITLNSGENRTITATYVQLASVYAVSDPSWLSAQWRIDNGPWQPTGTSAYNLSFGTPHTVEFAPIEGYVAPQPQTVTLLAGENRTITGSYVQLASIYVTSDPYWIGAQWRIDGGSWQATGTSAYNLSFGTPHTVEFSDVTGYITPASQTITLSTGESRTLTGAYTALASLSISLDLSAAKWRIDGGKWNNAGVSVYNLIIGTHTIEYSQHDGYLTPAAETLTLSSGPNWFMRNYAPDPSFVYDPNLASLAITLDPSFAEWRVDGGRWNTSGATRFNLTSGAHTVEYATLADYISPSSETVTLATGSGQTLYTRYISIDPAQLTVTTNPANGQWRIYPYLWPASGDWHASGATATLLNPGPYTIEYAPVTGYDSPTLTFTELLPNESQTLSASYVPQMFQYKIVLNPSTGRFRFPGSAWNPSGATVMGNTPGQYVIEFEPVAGYATPAPATVTFEAGANEVLTFTYTPL